MTLALRGEHLWDHCGNGVDITDFAELAINKPTPVNPAEEREMILNWLAKNAQAKVLINRKISSIITN